MKKISTMAMVRAIRDAQHKKLKGKTHAQVMDYFNEKSETLTRSYAKAGTACPCCVKETPKRKYTRKK
jgi:hypothetical protein